MPRNSGKNNRRNESVFQAERDAMRMSRTRIGRKAQEKEDAYWIDEQVSKLQEAFPQIDEALIRDQFLASGQKFELTVDVLVQLGSNPAPNRPMLIRKSQAAPKPAPTSVDVQPVDSDFPTLLAAPKKPMDEWEILDSDEIVFEENMLEEKLSWAALAKKNETAFEFAREPKVFHHSPSPTKKSLFRGDDSKKDSSDEEFSTAFVMRKGRAQKNRQSKGFHNNQADCFCDE